MSRCPDYRVGITPAKQRQYSSFSGDEDPRKVAEPIPRRMNRHQPQQAPSESLRQQPDRFQSEVFSGAVHAKPSGAPPRHNDFRGQLEPFLQRRDSAKRLRIYFSRSGHPIDSHAVGQAVDAHALVRLGNPIRCAFPEPQDVPFPGFTHLNESAFAGSCLKCLKY